MSTLRFASSVISRIVFYRGVWGGGRGGVGREKMYVQYYSTQHVVVGISFPFYLNCVLNYTGRCLSIMGL